MTVLCICQTGLREIWATGETPHGCVWRYSFTIQVDKDTGLINTSELQLCIAQKAGKRWVFPSEWSGTSFLSLLPVPWFWDLQTWTMSYIIGSQAWAGHAMPPEHPYFWQWVIPDLQTVLGQKTDPLQQYSHYQDVQCRHFEVRTQNELWASYIAYGFPPLNGLITL